MKGGVNNPTSFGRRILLAVFVVALASLANPISCHALQTVLLLRQSPMEGGTINLGEGVHLFEQYTDVTLTAIPKSGWQFVCWLGDVSDTTTPTTTAFTDTPKIIIAVFTRVAYEFLAGELIATSSPGQAQNLIRTAQNYAWGLEEGEIPYSAPPTPPPPPISDKFPVPLPEPTTIVLLAVSSMYIFRKRPKYRHTKRVNSR